MCHGGVATEVVQVNDDTFWSGAPSDGHLPDARTAVAAARRAALDGRWHDATALVRAAQGPYTEAYLPLADLRLAFDHEPGTASGYVRALDLDTATATVSYEHDGTCYTRATFVSAPAGTFVLRLTTDRPGGLSFAVSLDAVLPHRLGGMPGDGLFLAVKAPAHVDPPYLESAEPVVHDERRGQGMNAVAVVRVATEGGTVNRSDAGLRVTGASGATVVLATATGFRGFEHSPDRTVEECLGDAGGRADAVVARSYDDVVAEHLSDHRRFFRRVTLDLGPPPAPALPLPDRVRLARTDPDQGRSLAVLVFQYGRYLLLAASRPGTQPANLQGVWNAQLRPPWGSNYTLNINTQMNYWPAEVTALPECHTPLLDFVAELAITGGRAAATSYGLPGWVAHHNSDLWRYSFAVGAGSGDPSWANWWMGGAWLAHHLWEHYAFGGDTQYLRRAYPVLRGAAEFCLAWLVEDQDGHLVTAPSTSPENLFLTDGEPASVTFATTMDMSVVAQVFADCITAARALDVDADLAGQLAVARARLRPPGVGSRGQLLEWPVEVDDVDPHHRHMSHLFGLHPGHGFADDTRLRSAARQSLEDRGDASTGWSLAWKTNLWARLGDGDRAHRLLQNFLTPITTDEVSTDQGGVYPNLLCAHPPFQIDGNFGMTSAIAEMLLQSHAGTLDLLPALPAAWPTGTATGLRARGGFTVDLAWRDGRLASAVVRPSRSGPCTLRADGRTLTWDAAAGGSYQIGPDLTVLPRTGSAAALSPQR
jgi:alpha-L-fucosidase 2